MPALDQGLTAAEVAERRAEGRTNDVPDPTSRTVRQIVRANVFTPFNALLGVLLVVILAVGEYRDALFGIVLVLNALIGIVQELRAKRSLDQLAVLNQPRSLVRRDGVEAEVPSSELVADDVVVLTLGDQIAVDGEILTAAGLEVDESLLTGEADPVAKQHGATVMSGSFVVAGSGSIRATAVGTEAYAFKLASDARRFSLVKSELRTGIDKVIKLVSWLMAPTAVLLVTAQLDTHEGVVEAVQASVAGLVAMVPEGLVLLTSIAFAVGATRLASKKVLTQELAAIEGLARVDVICLDKTGTLTQDHIVLERHLNVVGEEDDWVLSLAYLNSYYQTGLKNLLDMAVLEHGELHDELSIDHAYGKVDEIPFDFARRRMSVVLDHEGRHHQLVCKGAVEEILAVCRFVRDEERVEPLDAARRNVAQDVAEELNEDGFRVVAVAYREFDRRDGPYTRADEQDLVLAGFIAFLDPPKESAAPALRALEAHGVAVKILTGDNDIVTRKVCHDVGLDAGVIVLGPQVAALDDAALGELAEKTMVFAKLTPDDKVRIVRSLRARSHTVGFMGDGINDAGALREADVGISVDTAVDIAKESADLILLEKSLMVLEEGVVEGRKTFGNTIKYIKMAASSNFGNVFSVLVASAFLPFLPMLPVQMLVQNLLYDISQAAIPWDEMDPEWLRVPRRWKADDIGRFMFFVGPISSVFDITTFLILWFVFGANAPEHASFFQSGWFIEGLASQTLIVHMIRTARVPFVQSRASWPVIATTISVILVGVMIPFTPFGASAGMEPLPWTYFPFLVVVLVSYTLLTQLVKGWYIRRFNSWL